MYLYECTFRNGDFSCTDCFNNISGAASFVALALAVYRNQNVSSSDINDEILEFFLSDPAEPVINFDVVSVRRFEVNP